VIQLQLDLQHTVHALLWPVILGIVYLYGTTLIAAGRVAHEAWRRSRSQSAIRAHLEADMALAMKASLSQRELMIETILQRFEGRQMNRINRLRMTIRLGPSLGLIGTLIPMASALAELANGNLPALAHNMVNAFASTVFGIAISVIAYILAAMRESWMRSDDRELRLHAESLMLHANETSGGLDEVR
jgi:biopolymer transport protein ExbB/TolQ